MIILKENNEMKALTLLKEYANIDFGCSMNTHQEECVEAISELEALQSRSCEGCKHWKVSNTLVVSNECFRWSGRVMTTKDFCCNRYEPKEQ